MNSRIKHTLLLVALAWSCVAFAQDTSNQTAITEDPFNLDGSPSRGVYGSDNRINVTQATGYEVFGKATLVMISKSSIEDSYIDAEPLREYLKDYQRLSVVSPNVRFLDEPTAGFCTGFLIAPDIMVTAGHCISDSSDLENASWLLDYTSDMIYNPQTEELRYNKAQLIDAVEIIATSDSRDGDYAVVRLSRTLDREPYRFRISGKIAQGQDLYMIGSPTGLPLKFVDDAKVVANDSKTYFEANLDAFAGNSGGPVFDVRGWIEGILVRGAEDYEVNFVTRILSVSEEDQYANYVSEDVQRITGLPEEVLVQAVYSNIKYAIEHNDMKRLNSWMIYAGIADHPYVVQQGGLEKLAIDANNKEALNLIVASSAKYGAGMQKGGELMQFAIAQGHNDYLAELLQDGYNPNFTDSLGETPIVWAVKSGNFDAVDMLMKRGGSIDVQFALYGGTFLHYAVRNNDMELLDKMISMGIDPEIKNDHGRTACKLAKYYDRDDMKKTLKRAEKAHKQNNR